MIIKSPDIESSGANQKPISILVESTCRSASRVAVADKATLYAQGEPASTLFLILDGFVKTSHICEDGTEITMDLLKCGEIAGEFFNPQLPLVYEETARAIGDAVVQRVLADDLRAAMEVNPRLAIFVAEHLAGSKRWVQRRLLRAMTQSVEWRVIEMLVELAGTFGKQCPHAGNKAHTAGHSRLCRRFPSGRELDPQRSSQARPFRLYSQHDLHKR
jgi:Cyclic nucleotide-binding domain